MIIVGEERKWKMDTNNERFRVVIDKGIHYDTHWFVIEYDTDGRRQTVRKQDLEEKTVVVLDCYDCKDWKKGSADGTCIHYINNDCPYGYHDADVI